MNSPPAHRRSLRTLLRFSLRGGLVLLTVISVALGVLFQRIHAQRAAVSAIERMGGEVWYGYELDSQSLSTVGDVRSQMVQSLSAICGRDCFSRVEGVFVNKPEVSDQDLRVLRSVPNLRFINLQNTAVQGGFLEHVRGCRTLDTIRLNGTAVNDTALPHLAAIPNLRMLYLNETSISDEGLMHIADSHQLISVDLSKTSISDQGLRHLRGLRGLKYLSVYSTPGLTSEGLQQLQADLPGLQISP